MSVKAKLSYPEAMRKAITEDMGMEWWAEGGEYPSFAAALERAHEKAEEMNFPVQVTCLGQSMTVYPEAIGY